MSEATPEIISEPLAEPIAESAEPEVLTAPAPDQPELPSEMDTPAPKPAAEPTSETAPEPSPEPIPEPAQASAPVEEPEPPTESFAEIFSEFQRTHSRRDADDTRQISGTVITQDAEFVYVDIGFKSEGIVPLTAFPAGREPVKPGDTLLVSPKGRNTDGYYELSLFRTAQPRDWTSLERAFEDKSTIVGTVTGIVKGGLHVDVGIRAFLPASRSGARDASEMEKLVGTEIRCRITKLDIQDEDVVVDRRIVTDEEALQTKANRFAEVREGAIVPGIVRSLTDYGAFIDLGGVDGLLHISDISRTRIAKSSDVLTVGQEIEVKVLKIEPDGHRISLGLKQLQADPWDSALDRYALGQTVRGVVTRTTDFGAFVEIEPSIEGLVHLSEMSWSKRILKATEVMKAGDIIEAVIITLNPVERRISLSLKQALGDPWAEASKWLHVGAVVSGPVASITKFGAFIQVAEGVEGLVHISEIVADRRLNHPSDVLHVGEHVQAQVLGVDPAKRQLRLSIKQLIPTGLDEFLAEHSIGDIVTGRVISVENTSAQVELGDGIVRPCTLPAAAPAAPAPAPQAPSAAKVDLSAFSSMLKTKWKTGSASSKPAPSKAGPVAPGQVRSFKITQLDPAKKQVAIELVP